jgi:hypothetical protein
MEFVRGVLQSSSRVLELKQTSNTQPIIFLMVGAYLSLSLCPQFLNLHTSGRADVLCFRLFEGETNKIPPHNVEP